MDNMDSMIGKRLDERYELMELIGAGGMADIRKVSKTPTEHYIKVSATRVVSDNDA